MKKGSFNITGTSSRNYMKILMLIIISGAFVYLATTVTIKTTSNQTKEASRSQTSPTKPIEVFSPHKSLSYNEEKGLSFRFSIKLRLVPSTFGRLGPAVWSGGLKCHKVSTKLTKLYLFMTLPLWNNDGFLWKQTGTREHQSCSSNNKYQAESTMNEFKLDFYFFPLTCVVDVYSLVSRSRLTEQRHTVTCGTESCTAQHQTLTTQHLWSGERREEKKSIKMSTHNKIKMFLKIRNIFQLTFMSSWRCGYEEHNNTM